MMINNRSTCATGRRLPGSLRIWSTLTRASFWGGCGRDGFLAVTGGVCCLQRDRSRAQRNLSVRLQRITVTKARDLRVKHGNPRTSVPDVLQFGRQRVPSRFSHARPKERSRSFFPRPCLSFPPSARVRRSLGEGGFILVTLPAHTAVAGESAYRELLPVTRRCPSGEKRDTGFCCWHTSQRRELTGLWVLALHKSNRPYDCCFSLQA